MPTFSDDNARITVSELNAVIQGMAEKNNLRFRRSDGTGGVGIEVSATQPASLNIWIKPVGGAVNE